MEPSSPHNPNQLDSPKVGEETGNFIFHPAADIFPLLSEQELQDMAKDLKENGLRQAIIVCNGRIIDGRNRFEACKLAGITPSFEHRNDLSEADIVSLIISANLARRHLDPDQRATLAARLVTMRPGNAQAQKKADPAKCGISISEASKIAKVSPAKVERARALQKAAPDLAKKVEVGGAQEGKKLTINKALKIAKMREKKDEAHGDAPSSETDSATTVEPHRGNADVAVPTERMDWRTTISNLRHLIRIWDVLLISLAHNQDEIFRESLIRSLSAIPELKKIDCSEAFAIAKRLKKEAA